jgi:hypothetical protein
MAGGTIYEKTKDDYGPQGDKDKCLIIEPKHAWQVPLSFGSDWTNLKVGFFYSYVLAGQGNENAGFSASSTELDVFNSGGTTPDTHTWIGLTKNQFTKALPSDPANEAFVGMRAHKINASSSPSYDSTDENINSLLTEFDSLRAYMYRGSVRDTSASTTAHATHVPLINNPPDVNFLGNPELTNTYFNYASFEFYFDPNPSNGYGNWIRLRVPTNASTVSASADPSLINLKSLIDGADEESGFEFNQFALVISASYQDRQQTYLDKLDSFIFYNGFQLLRPRIHAWAVKKIL